MWNDVVQCVKEIYSPFNVQIVDVDPGPTVVHHESIVAGHPTELGIPPPAPGAIVLGKAAVNGDHTAKNNDISWVFANAFTLYPTRALQVSQLCSTIGQETAHSWGLDHQWDCTDPMTYLNDCGGQKFFRNQADPCGTGDVPSPQCNCDGGCSSSGPTQNSHQMILSVFGAGQSIVPGPTVALLTPKDGDPVTNGFIADISSTAKRGTFKVDLILNGYTWATQKVSTDPKGAAKSPIYAPTFALNAPMNVPDGVIDVEVRACDDIDQCSSAKATVTKGAPCSDAATQCAKGQKCEAGKCFWDAATGEVGDTCDYPQACKSGICFGATGSTVCTQNCFTGIAGQCPDGFSCQLDATQQGHCLIAAGGGDGCCSASDESTGATLARGGLAGFVMLLVFGRRRRRRGAAA
jgi:MYXO-CTERM domain-containing protein